MDRRSATTHAWAMHGSTVLAERDVSARSDHEIEAAISDWLAKEPADVVTCGASAELTMVPAKPGNLEPQCDRTMGTARVWSLPGLRQDTPSDLMQGAETTIAGFLSLNPNWDGVICLPGPQTHWAQISADEVVSFQSFLSLGIFEALCPDTGLPAPDAQMIKAADDTMSRPERLARHLNAARVDARLDPLATAAPPMLGTLIGAELGAARAYWLGQQIALIGPDDMTAPYAAALQAQAAMVTRADGQRMTLAGLTQAWRRLATQDNDA